MQRLPFSKTLLFYERGHYNIAICRMAMALALMHTLFIETHADYAYFHAIHQNDPWIPKGIVKILFADGLPPVPLMEALYMTALVAIAMMFVGLFTRISSLVATFATVTIISVYWSPFPYWSHASNVVLLSALAFMLGRSGDRWSVDAYLRELFRRPDPYLKQNGSYWWPVLLAELATHLFMFGAFYSKFTNGDGFWWAWSDNLRNSIGITWGMYRFDPPAIAEFLAASPWAYKTAGTLQLFAQASTIFAIFLVRRPVLRAIIGGGFFFIEIVGLGRVFEFWHPAWMMLCLLSIDYEYFYAQARDYFVRRRARKSGEPVIQAAEPEVTS